MSNINYLNPVSMAPELSWKPGPAYSAQLYNEKVEDYNKLMANQMYLQDIGARSAANELENKLLDNPVLAAQRRAKLTTMESEFPYLAEKAAEGAKADIMGKRFEQVQKGPEAQDDFIKSLKKGQDNHAWQQFKRENEYALNLIDTASQMDPDRAMQYVDTEMERAGKLGINMHPVLKNPMLWDQIRKGLVNNIAQAQALEKEEQQSKHRMEYGAARDAAAMERNRYSVDAATARAGIKAAGTDKHDKNYHQGYARLLNDYTNATNEADREEIRNAMIPYADNLLGERLKGNAEVDKDLATANNKNLPPEKRKKAQERLLSRRESNREALVPGYRGGTAPAQPQQGTRPPLESFK